MTDHDPLALAHLGAFIVPVAIFALPVLLALRSGAGAAAEEAVDARGPDAPRGD